jgi:hypothetical protein
MNPSRSKPSLFVLAACTIGAIGGVVAMRFAASVYANHDRLEKRGVQVTARVTEARKDEIRGAPSFEIRYAFEVAGNPRTFTLTDETGREDLWATTDGQPEWELAQQTGRVQALYLPDDPTINRLVTRRGHPLGDPVGVLVLGLLLLGMSAGVGWLEASGQGWRWRRLVARMRGVKGGV